MSQYHRSKSNSLPRHLKTAIILSDPTHVLPADYILSHATVQQLLLPLPSHIQAKIVDTVLKYRLRSRLDRFLIHRVPMNPLGHLYLILNQSPMEFPPSIFEAVRNLMNNENIDYSNSAPVLDDSEVSAAAKYY